MLNRFLNTLVNISSNLRRKRIYHQVNRILREEQAADTSVPEANFERLQAEWPPYPEYGYDSYSTWERAIERCNRLLHIGDFKNPGYKILDVGAGDGMLGVALNAYGHKVILTDLEDWRDFRASNLDFFAADSCAHLPFPENHFDLIFSYNTFEHLPDPKTAMDEIVRVLCPGGTIYLEFGPLYTGPWGLHAYRTLRMPYPQYLFSSEFIEYQLTELGIWDLGKKRTELQFTNKWKPEDYDSLWLQSGCSLVSKTAWEDDSCLPIVLRFPQAFYGRNLTVRDLIAGGLAVILKK